LIAGSMNKQRDFRNALKSLGKVCTTDEFSA